MRKLHNILTAGVILLLIQTVLAQPKEFKVDKVHTNIGFSVSHMVISKVSGEFKEYDINFVLDEKAVPNSEVEVRIKSASIDTDNEKRDSDLRNTSFLDVQNHPEIVFQSNRIEKNADGYTAYGELTIKGVTKEIALPFKLNGPIKDPWGNTRVGIEAKLTINRFDYGVSWDKTLDTGGLVAGRDVDIDIQAEFVSN